MIRSRLPVLPLALALVVGCSGNCSENAVVIAEEVQKVGRTIDSIEVYADTNSDGVFSRDERGFVIDPRPTIKKIIRIAFLVPVSRQAVGELGGIPTSPFFLTFASLFDPFPSPWVEAVYFDDDPFDPFLNGPPTLSVTYRLRDNLVAPIVAQIAVPVRVTLGLDRIDSIFQPADFGFILARQAFQASAPPRITTFSPTPSGPNFLP